MISRIKPLVIGRERNRIAAQAFPSRETHHVRLCASAAPSLSSILLLMSPNQFVDIDMANEQTTPLLSCSQTPHRRRLDQHIDPMDRVVYIARVSRQLLLIVSDILHTSALTVEQLQAGVQALPQELFDQISALTFTVNSGPVMIDTDYKPPSYLQICSNSRKELLPQYYGRASWLALGHQLRSERYKTQTCVSQSLISAWLISLSEDNLLTIQRSCTQGITGLVHAYITPVSSTSDGFMVSCEDPVGRTHACLCRDTPYRPSRTPGIGVGDQDTWGRWVRIRGEVRGDMQTSWKFH